MIGASGADVRQPPDMILWAALGDWGVRLDPGRMHQVRAECVARSVRRSGIEEELTDDSAVWHPVVCRLKPDPFPDDVTLELTPSEATLLKELLVDAEPVRRWAAAARLDSLLARLVDEGCPAAVDLPWEHPAVGASPELREAMRHAGLFSDAIHGARLLYAVMVGEVRHDDDDFHDRATAAYEHWVRAIIEPRSEELADWSADLQPFWRTVERVNSRIGREKGFVRDWVAYLRRDPERLPQDASARKLILDREHFAKGAKRARLAKDGTVGRDARAVIPNRLTFRWSQATTISTDIRAGLAH